jgi:hypothetical protein
MDPAPAHFGEPSPESMEQWPWTLTAGSAVDPTVARQLGHITEADIPTTPLSPFPILYLTNLCLWPGCKSPQKEFLTSQDLDFHIQTYHMRHCPWPTCNIQRSFRRRSDLLRHMESVHSGFRRFACDLPGCNKTYARGDKLTAHKRSHFNRTPGRPQTAPTEVQTSGPSWNCEDEQYIHQDFQILHISQGRSTAFTNTRTPTGYRQSSYAPSHAQCHPMEMPSMDGYSLHSFHVSQEIESGATDLNTRLFSIMPTQAHYTCSKYGNANATRPSMSFPTTLAVSSEGHHSQVGMDLQELGKSI